MCSTIASVLPPAPAGVEHAVAGPRIKQFDRNNARRVLHREVAHPVPGQVLHRDPVGQVDVRIRAKGVRRPGDAASTRRSRYSGTVILSGLTRNVTLARELFQGTAPGSALPRGVIQRSTSASG